MVAGVTAVIIDIGYLDPQQPGSLLSGSLKLGSSLYPVAKSLHSYLQPFDDFFVSVSSDPTLCSVTLQMHFLQNFSFHHHRCSSCPIPKLSVYTFTSCRVSSSYQKTTGGKPLNRQTTAKPWDSTGNVSHWVSKVSWVSCLSSQKMVCVWGGGGMVFILVVGDLPANEWLCLLQMQAFCDLPQK